METEMVSGNVNSIATQSPEEEVIVSAEDIINRLQEELQLIRLENKQCWRRVQQLETTVARMRSTAQCSKEERDRLKKKLRELQIRLTTSSSPVSRDEHGSDNSAGKTVSPRPGEQRASSKIVHEAVASADFRPPTPAVSPKIAERVRLKRFPTEEVYGPEISSLGVSNIHLAEHLAETVKNASQLQELYRSITTSARQQEFEIELENLRSQIKRMKSQVSFLELTLNESRTLSDNLSSHCAQLESNETALQLAQFLSDYIEQGMACLLELGDSRLALVLASCQAVHFDHGEENSEMLSLARKEREQLELEAKKLLKRFQNEVCDFLNGLEIKTSHDPGNVAADNCWTQDDENQLRLNIKMLQTQRDTIRSSVVKVQSTSSFLPASGDRGNAVSRSLQEEKLSLENVVLLQELMAMKEEKMQVKAKLLVLEKENEILTLSNREKDLQLTAIQQQNGKEQKDSNQVSDQADMPFSQSSALLENVVATQELRQRKSDHLMEYLKRVNDSLLDKLQRQKRKHKSKLRRLQYALRYVSEQYELELSALRGRMSLEGARDSGHETLHSNTSEG